MNIFVLGGTGFIGKAVINLLLEKGHKVTLLSRSSIKPKDMPDSIIYIQGSPLEKGQWSDKLIECDAVINLAGAPIFTKWSSRNRQNIRNSRIKSTKNLVDALKSGKDIKTQLLINASAIGIYPELDDKEITEQTGDREIRDKTSDRSNFLSEVAQQWEKEAEKAKDCGVRTVICRTGVVLGKEGGALKTMLPFFKINLGSPLGSGKQWFSWIYIKDMADIILYAVENKKVSGPINCTAPYPVRNEEYTKELARALGKSAALPAVPAFVLKLIFGQSSALLLSSQKVLPGKLLEYGFVFKYPRIRDCLDDIFFLK
ncbi:hypothetical protein MCHI_001522 [Candidatus Magnetoovum chiemensis]|nr:hypothetical protein MCHI_001522 [Candidatus Magnetoovum chiemensis]